MMKKIPLLLCALCLIAAQAPAQKDYSKEFSKHTIESLRVEKVTLYYPRMVGKNSHKDHGASSTADVCVVRTTTGLQAIGQIRGMKPELFEQKASLLKGRKFSEIFSVAEGPLIAEARDIDVPLWDLAGIILGKPVCELWGKPAIQKIPLYSGMIYMDDLDAPDAETGIKTVVDNARWDYQAGYRQLKLKIGRSAKWMPHDEGLQRDVEITRRIVAALPDVKILVDANDGYTPEDMIAYMKGIEGIPLYWIEEPFPETPADCRALRRWLDTNGRKETLIADGEVRPQLEDLLEMGRQGVVNVYLDDIIGYGFTPWAKLMPRLKAAGMQASPHCWGNQLKTFYTAHLGMALGNVCTVEGVTCTSDRLDFGPAFIKDGFFVPSGRPGFGITLKE